MRLGGDSQLFELLRPRLGVVFPLLTFVAQWRRCCGSGLGPHAHLRRIGVFWLSVSIDSNPGFVMRVTSVFPCV